MILGVRPSGFRGWRAGSAVARAGSPPALCHLSVAICSMRRLASVAPSSARASGTSRSPLRRPWRGATRSDPRPQQSLISSKSGVPCTCGVCSCSSIAASPAVRRVRAKAVRHVGQIKWSQLGWLDGTKKFDESSVARSKLEQREPSRDIHFRSKCSRHWGSPSITVGTKSIRNSEPGSAIENTRASHQAFSPQVLRPAPVELLRGMFRPLLACPLETPKGRRGACELGAGR